MSTPSSPTTSTVALVSTSPEAEWQPILHASHQVVLYNPKSHALTISRKPTLSEPSTSSVIPARAPRHCPYCKQPLPASGYDEDELEHSHDDDEVLDEIDSDPAYHSRATNYFQILEVSNELTSRPASPYSIHSDDDNLPSASERSSSTFPAENMAEGYFNRFFQEEYKLGMGANGSVFLCQHVLDGNPLGHFAVKKIAVGESHSYLLKILREVRLLEQLRHPNIVTYHHAWLETYQFSAFGPRVPTLHVLMQWAEGGSLDDFIDIRLGRRTAHPHIHPVPAEPIGDLNANRGGARTPTQDPPSMHSRSARIRAFKAFQRASPEERERMKREGYGSPDGPERKKNEKEWTPVHLLSAEEVKGLFQDVVEGLGFLHNKSILHLDLKPGNVLLTWDDGRIIPRAMLSDFGTSRDMINSTQSQRTGNTGTLEYASPESLPSPDTGRLRQIDSKSDMWSLGMILHKMLFFKLPYRYAAEGDANGEPVSVERGQENIKMERLEQEVLQYPGFKGNSTLVSTFEARRLSRAYLVLLESLLHKAPSARPSCERVASAIRDGKLNPLVIPLARETSRNGSPDALVPRPRLTPESQMRERTPSPNSETTKFLRLPPTTQDDLPAPQPTGIQGWIAGKRSAILKSETWKSVDRAMRSRNGRLYMRLVRSVLLVTKVMNIPRICAGFERHPRPLMLTTLLAAAVADTVVDIEPWHRSILLSLGLAAFHVGVMKYTAGTVLSCAP